MNFPLFNIGLTLMSIDHIDKNLTPTAEGRRILSILKGSPLTEQDILKDDNGRPYLSGNRGQADSIDFNISHSGNMTAVSLVKGTGFRTGCDVQLVKNRTNTLKIAERFFSNSEVKYILSQKEKGNDTAFFEIWTLKECYIKLRGLSVFDIGKIPSFFYENRDGAETGSFAFYTDNTAPLSFYLYKLSDKAKEYIMATAIEGTAELQPSIHWFSESILPCKSIVTIKAAPSPTETVSPNM